MPFQDRFVNSFPNPLEVDEAFANLALEHSELCRIEQLPYESHGYQGQREDARGRHLMNVVRITAPNSTMEKPAVLLMRSHHAREWINAIAVVETARQLLENYRSGDPDPRVRRVVSILDKTEVIIVPEGNPDGARLSFFDTGYRLWRKNLRPGGEMGGPGVDCNRNYSRYWGQAGSSGEPSAETYRGPAAFSEPESANIAALTARYRNIIFAIDSHSYGQSIFRPTRSGGRYIPTLPVAEKDELIYQNLEMAMNRGIRPIRGETYSTGTTSNHAGTTDEYFYFDQQIFGFDLESGRQFQPPFAEANLAALEVAEAVKSLAWCAAGKTGLNIPVLLDRRKALDQAELAILPHFDRFDDAWEIPRLPPERWPRFVVECRVTRPANIVRENLQLQDYGFDVIGQSTDKLEIVASAEDLTGLLRLGYRPQIVRDLGLEEGWHG